jgi:hypothetical protein
MAVEYEKSSHHLFLSIQDAKAADEGDSECWENTNCASRSEGLESVSYLKQDCCL